MRDIKNKLTSSKNTSNIQTRKGKSFGYQVLGFGAGGSTPQFITATGGTIKETGNFRTHIFTGTGVLSVSAIAPAGSGNPNVVDYLVVGGGGGGAYGYSGGGGAGGFRVSNHPGSGIPSPTMSPLVTTTGVTLSVQDYTLAVGAGGPGPSPPICASGQLSSGLGISSAGGGGAASNQQGNTGQPGGSGGSGRGGGNGNQPPVSPPQGNNGGTSPPGINAQGGGGGAAAAGGNGGPPSSVMGPGGIGSFIADALVGSTAPSYGTPGPTGSTRYFSGGGGGGADSPPGANVGGKGGGGSSYPGDPQTAKNGGVNTGGGAGGISPGATSGGSGIVMIRYKFQ